LVHAIEPAALDALPGNDKTVYLSWQQFEAGIGHLVRGAKRVAMEYSPRNGNMYISRVDAGTVELVRSFGVEVVPSGDLIQQFEATWDDEQWALHLEAAERTDAAYGVAWAFIADQIRTHGYTVETAVQARILQHFADTGMTTYSPPVYSDLTRVGYVGEDVPAKINQVFHVVRDARDAAIDRVRRAFAAGVPLHGWQVDGAAREVIERAGYGKFFNHRTGHNIGQETHGNGCHMDGLETREERLVMRRTCFSIEPGIYLPGEFGVRSEVNVYIDGDGGVHVTGGPLQTEVRRVIV
jgi:Xaa-Pro aminopeptidase